MSKQPHFNSTGEKRMEKMSKAGCSMKIITYTIIGITLGWVLLSIAVAVGLIGGIYTQIALWLPALALTGLAINAWLEERWGNSVISGIIALWFGTESFGPSFPILAQWANISIALIFLWAVITTTRKLLS